MVAGLTAPFTVAGLLVAVTMQAVAALKLTVNAVLVVRTRCNYKHMSDTVNSAWNNINCNDILHVTICGPYRFPIYSILLIYNDIGT